MCLAGCTTVRDHRGVVVLSTSSDIHGLRFHAADGTALDAGDVSNSKVHRTIGVNIMQGATSIGTAIATSGLVQ